MCSEYFTILKYLRGSLHNCRGSWFHKLNVYTYVWKMCSEYFTILKYLRGSLHNCRGSWLKYNMLLEDVWNKNKKKTPKETFYYY